MKIQNHNTPMNIFRRYMSDAVTFQLNGDNRNAKEDFLKLYLAQAYNSSHPDNIVDSRAYCHLKAKQLMNHIKACPQLEFTLIYKYLDMAAGDGLDIQDK